MNARRLGGLGTVLIIMAWGLLLVGLPEAGFPVFSALARNESLTVQFKSPSDTLLLDRLNRLLGTRVHKRLGAGRFELTVPQPQRLLDYSALFLALPGVSDVSPYPREEFTLHPQVSIQAQNRTLERRERVETSPSPTVSPSAGQPLVTERTVRREETTLDRTIGIPVPIQGGHEVFVTFRNDPDQIEAFVREFNAVFGTKVVDQQGFRTFRLRLPDGLDPDRAVRIFSLVPDVANVEPSYGR